MQEAQQITEDAYIYGYPLVTMEMTRRVMTNVREPEATRAPMGHLLRLRTYPAAEFKDVTAPNADYFFVDNPLNRYTLSARNDLKLNADGSVDLYLQQANPGPEKESNWLPAPARRFIPMLRLYWPTEKSPSILNGTWKIPAVQKAK